MKNLFGIYMDRNKIKKRLIFWNLFVWLFLIIAVYQGYFVYFVDLTSTKSNSQTFTPNIDTYRNNTQKDDVNKSNNTLNNNGYNADNGYNKPYRPEVQYNSNNFNRAYNNYGYGYNGNGGYNNGFGYNGYGYGYNTPFNPNRNTDTYAPFARNIDTYRYNNNAPIGRAVMTETQTEKNDENETAKSDASTKIQKEEKTKFQNKHDKNQNMTQETNLNEFSKKYENNSTERNAENEVSRAQKHSLSNKIFKTKRPKSRPMTAPKIIKNDKNQGSKVI